MSSKGSESGRAQTVFKRLLDTAKENFENVTDAHWEHLEPVSKQEFHIAEFQIWKEATWRKLGELVGRIHASLSRRHAGYILSGSQWFTTLDLSSSCYI